MIDPQRQFLRHTLAALAYRAGKTLRAAPEGFSGFRAGQNSRTPGQILAHLSDLIDWAVSMAKGKETWHDSEPLPWGEGVDRFFAALRAFDDLLASGMPLAANVEKLFQGPVADSLTHVGQVAMLRRLAASPIRGENYFRADIAAGRVGPEQPSPTREFD